MGRLSAARYRLSQLRWSLGARLQERDRAWVEGILSPAEQTLFFRMPSYDQMHSVLVARDLEGAGAEEWLLRAALLHDCGKTLPDHRVPLLYRGGVVLVRVLSSRLLHVLARPSGPLWPVYLHVHHPEMGAQVLEQAGSPPEVVSIVRTHQEPTSDPVLQQLQQADARH